MRKNTIEVFLNEEYGYKTWIWRPNMNEEEFVSWWQNLTDSDIIKYFFNIKALPGTLKEYSERSPGGSAVGREYGDPKSHRPYYYCHFHDVNDSYICVGNESIRFISRAKYDWKEHWFDYTSKRQKSKVNQ
jgi:hypothetical protein